MLTDLAGASNNKESKGFMHEFAKKQKILEINPRSPLIEGLLRRVQQLPAEDEEKDVEAEAELHEVTSILIDGALVRSGFEVADSNLFFTRVDRVLRRSLGVNEHAKTDTNVKPAPPVDPELPVDEDMPGIQLPDHMKDKVELTMEAFDEDDDSIFLPSHDEL